MMRNALEVFAAVLVILSFCALSFAAGRAEREKYRIILPCRVTEVYDGDTATVEVTIPLRVRLLDCWAPEVRTRDDAEKARGLAARDYLRHWIEGEEGALVIPLERGQRLDHLFSFGRILGRLEVHGLDVSEAMVRSGHATAEKEVR